MMYSAFYELEAAVKKGVAQEDFGGALDSLRDFVVRVMNGQAAPGEVVGSRKVDELCSLVGETYFHRFFPSQIAAESFKPATKRIVIVCTGLYKYGGTSLVIGDLVRAHPDCECIVLATNYLNDMSREDLELSRIGGSGAMVSICPPGAADTKLNWLISQFLEMSPSRIFLLNHHQDSVIVSAARPFTGWSKVLFYHHADYNLCLGVHLDGAIHVDPHNVGFYNCREKEQNPSNVYVPMTLGDLRNTRGEAPFLRSGSLTTCSSGHYHKFRNFYLYPYKELIVDRLKVRDGRHIHIGGVPESELAEISASLRSNGVDAERFVHIQWTESLWATLIAEGVDLFIGSFPIGGARTTIEVMGAGVPILMPDNYLSRFFSSRDIVYRDALIWKYPADFSRIIESTTPQLLVEHSALSRAHYDLEYNSRSVDLRGILDAICAGDSVPPPYGLYPHSPDHLDKALHADHIDDLTSSYAVRQALASGTRPSPEAQPPSPLASLSARDQELYAAISSNPESIGFDPDTYLKRNPDVDQAGVDPLIHFIEFGQHEQRSSTFFFSPDWHAEMNDPHLANPGDVLLHLARTRSETARMKVAFFAYAWNSARRPDAYISEMIATLANLGLNVDVYIAGQFSGNQGTIGLRPDLSGTDLNAFIQAQSYDFSISFNNALILADTVRALRCTVVSVIVDSIHHLFDHTEEGLHRPFELPIHAAPIYTSFIQDVAASANFKAAATFLPAATRVAGRDADPHQEPIAISFIASMLGDYNLDAFMSRVEDEIPGGLGLVTRCLSSIGRIGEISMDPETQEAARVLCAWSHWDYPLLEMHLQEVVTNGIRLSIAERLAPLGLRIFGNARWRAALALTPSVAQCYRTGADLRRHADLCSIYDRSKISINVPQVHAGTGMQYRVLDILASKSLLVTKCVPGSDMERLFGANSPIVTFADLDDLHAKCVYYLNNESERLSRVRECNALVARGFSFRDRVLEYLALSNPSRAEQVGSLAGRGSVTLIWPERVVECAVREGRRAA